MHRWLLVVLVLLLPLRGLAGVAMASQMLEQHAGSASAIQGTHHVAADRALHDCDDHHASAPVAAEADAAATGDLPGDCPTCASCQACSAVVLAPSLPQAFGEAQPQAPPQMAVHALASAEPALALKPPQS